MKRITWQCIVCLRVWWTPADQIPSNNICMECQTYGAPIEQHGPQRQSNT